MLRSFILVLALAALAVLAVAAPARAETTGCQANIDSLRAATQSATFVGQNAAKDQAGLIGKLDSATTKLEQGKVADAVQELTQFRDKVTALDAQGKIDHADAQALIAGANDAIACLQPTTA